jgi:ribosome-binding factor A
MVSRSRAARIARKIQKELSEILIFEATDPRLAGAYITDVSVDRELAFASIYVSALEGVERQAEILEGFVNANRYLRGMLVRRIELRSFPQLRFNWDPTPENADKIDQLIYKIQQEEQSDESDANSEPDDSK